MLNEVNILESPNEYQKQVYKNSLKKPFVLLCSSYLKPCGDRDYLKVDLSRTAGSNISVKSLHSVVHQLFVG